MLTKKVIHEVMSSLGRIGGKKTSPAKRAAARENGKLGKEFGKLGGRPRKKKPKRNS